jgi:hypothetical protein
MRVQGFSRLRDAPLKTALHPETISPEERAASAAPGSEPKAAETFGGRKDYFSSE